MTTKITLKVTTPDGSSREAVLENVESVIVGSGPAAAVKVDDPKVSALHCMFKVEKDSLTVIDLGSESGTRVGGTAIKGATAVKPDEVVEIGGSRLQAFAGEPKKAEPKPVEAKPQEKAEAPRKTEEKKARPPPPPVGAGSFGRAARLFNEELPAEETPAPDAKQLEVAMLWGDTIINVRHFPAAGQVTVGNARGNHFHVFAASVGESFPLVTAGDKDATVSVPPGAGLVLRRGDSEKTREQLAGEGVLKASDGAVQAQLLAMQLHDRIQVTLDNVAFVIRWVRPHATLPSSMASFDFYFTRVLTTSFMAGIVLLAAIFITDINAETLSEDLFKNPQRFAKLVIKPMDKDLKKKFEKKEKKQPDVKMEDKFGQVKKDEKKGPDVNANKRERDEKVVKNAGLLAVLGSGDGSVANVFSPGGLGTQINQALGTLKDSGISDSRGIGGVGSRGIGPGGGGGGLGLGGLGTKGGGRGSKSGYGAIGLNSGNKGMTRVVPGKTTVTGSCERAIIGKVISRHANEIKYCYKMELTRAPDLAGKVAVSFTIDPTGAVSDANVAQTTMNSNNVEQCILSRIRRWKFPEPKGGGVCVINYPWVFKAAGSGDEGEGE